MSIRIIDSIEAIPDEVAAFQSAVSAARPGEPSGICGFDGFVDTFIHLAGPTTMAEFGPQVADAAGIATSFPCEHKGDKFGGNGPLLAAALSEIHSGAIDLAYIGGLGDPEVLPIFREALEGKVRHLHSLANPAHSDCLEFDDGKVMLSDMRACAEITWERLLERVGGDTLDTYLKSCDFIAAVNWGKLPHVGTIWSNLAKRLADLGIPAKQVVVFMDLAEFEQRPEEDRRELLDTVASVTTQCSTILSFNLKEAWQMGETLGGDFRGKKQPGEVAELATFLRKSIDVDRLIIHPNSGAAAASAEGCVFVPGPYCRKPLISTGAGDNFGAGCIAASLRGLDDIGILLAGNCASGYYVRSGRSASFGEMCRMLDLWRDGELPERL